MQPDIDVLWYDPEKEELNGVEVKCFRPTLHKEEIILTPKSYYVGLDEAVALLNYGVDHAWLFHVFDSKVPLSKVHGFTTYMKNLAEMS